MNFTYLLSNIPSLDTDITSSKALLITENEALISGRYCHVFGSDEVAGAMDTLRSMTKHAV